MQMQVRSSLRFTNKCLLINQDWWKPNLSWHVYYMKGSNLSAMEITHMVPKNLTATSVIPITIRFVNQQNLALQIYRIVQDFFPPKLAGQVEVYHDLQSTITKERTAKQFGDGVVRVLICTEALTMGCDFQKIEQVIIFKVPKTAPTVLQQGGRGGRDKTIKCWVVLMVEALKHKAVLSKSTPDPKHVKQAGIKKEEDIPVVLKDREVNRVISVDEIKATQQASVNGQGEGEGEGESEASGKTTFFL
ncbi:hypothetical protein FRC08_017117 [Ceratobasidium sp. 394]|nr:hypothetical protein FRC08_017117 [Ceratobasidium sp. 394]